MRYQARLTKLEARRSTHPSHHTPVVCIPGALDDAHWDAYLDALPCACGLVACEQRTIGLVLPQKLSLKVWEARYTPPE